MRPGGGAVSAVPARPDWAAETRGRVEQALEEAFAALPPTETARAARYATLGGGHRWRGLLAVAAGTVFSPEGPARALPLAAAVEMMHAASLVLDDLPAMDDAAVRRGRACVHLVFPDWVVALLPAFLVNLAYHVAAGASAAPADCRLRALRALGEMGARLAHGQELDLALARKAATAAELLDCYEKKSGALFAAALAGGALLCGAGDAEAGALAAAGRKLGQAYQILDDLADGPEETGAHNAVRRSTAHTLFGPVEARVRAEALLAEAARALDRFGPAAGPLRDLLERIRGG